MSYEKPEDRQFEAAAAAIKPLKNNNFMPASSLHVFDVSAAHDGGLHDRSN
jgi:hypothetical protein